MISAYANNSFKLLTSIYENFYYSLEYQKFQERQLLFFYERDRHLKSVISGFLLREFLGFVRFTNSKISVTEIWRNEHCPSFFRFLSTASGWQWLGKILREDGRNFTKFASSTLFKKIKRNVYEGTVCNEDEI